MTSAAAPRRPRASSAGRLGTRAVLRAIEPGESAECARCGQRVKFRARHKDKQAIANVYEGDRWDRIEHFHAGPDAELDCYGAAGEPYGEAL